MNSNSTVKTSLLIPSQLPEFIREDASYENFVLFIKSYYEWMEENGNVLDKTKNLLNYIDIDNTIDEFIEYFNNDFLQYIPEETFVSRKEAIRFAKQLYQAKGVPNSYKFLFRMVYNSDFDYYFTKDSVFRASDGIWYSPKSVRIKSDDPNFLKVKNYRLFGETSKTIATIENAVLSGTKTEIFISDITRLFQSGEFIRVVDYNNQDVLFDGQVLRGKIVGQISTININPSNRGLLYEEHDPVILYNGLTDSNSIGATAEVGSVTTGAIQTISLLSGGYGYTEFPNSIISISGSSTANAVISSVDPANRSNVNYYPIDTLNSPLSTGLGILKNVKLGDSHYYFAKNAVANINSKLEQTLDFISFNAYPIASVLLLNGGGGIKQLPQISAVSRIKDTSADTANAYSYIKNLGILAPIQISNGGKGYRANDVIVFTGGNGYGAYANVINVSTSGAITKIEYVQGAKKFPLGGMGYRSSSLPAVSVSSSNVYATNASIYIPGILGEGATFDATLDKIGAIGKINILNPGEDYIATPNVSLKVQDIVVSNVSVYNPPVKGDIVYQGLNTLLASYSATVDSVTLLEQNAIPSLSLYNLRVFNYSSKFKVAKPLAANGALHIANNNINMLMANTAFSEKYDSTGVKTYGDGKAKATASFLNGLVISEGMYISEQGQPSSYSILQNENFNDFTYQITVEREIEKYRDILMNLLHPSGMKFIGRYALKSNTHQFSTHMVESLYTGLPLDNYTGYPASGIEMVADFNNTSNNIIKFTNLPAGTNIANFIFANTTLIDIKSVRQSIRSEIISVNASANTVTIKDNVWLTFANVATIYANSNTNIINITTITDTYDQVNGGVYSNTMYPMMDIVYAGDTVRVANNADKTVSSVDYINGKIYLTTNLTSNSISYLSVNRKLIANNSQAGSEIVLYGPIGLEYVPELVTEQGITITTEDNKTIILG